MGALQGEDVPGRGARRIFPPGAFEGQAEVPAGGARYAEAVADAVVAAAVCQLQPDSVTRLDSPITVTPSHSRIARSALQFSVAVTAN